MRLKATLTGALANFAPAIIEPGHETEMTDMAHLLRDESGAVEVLHDRHEVILGLRAASGEGVT
jgi:threonine aldolase